MELFVTCRDCGGEFTPAGHRGPRPERCPPCKLQHRRDSQRRTAAPRIFRVLSLGAGQQSSALLLLSAAGILPRLDLAVFADTGWERQVVYDHLRRLTARAEAAGIPVRRVHAGNLRNHAVTAEHVPMPVFAHHDGKRVIFRQSCTVNWKIKPIRRLIRKTAGPLHGLTVHMWLGISLDEVFRLKPSPVQYIEHRYPLIDMRWTRDDCVRFLAEQGFADPPRSSCVGCPYRSVRQWREMRDSAPAEWADAVQFDTAMRTRPVPLYLHHSLTPLAQVADGRDDGDLFGEECEGHCGL